MEVNNKETIRRKRDEEAEGDEGMHIEAKLDRQAGRWRGEQANKRELVVDGCCDSSESEQDRSCFELLVWTDGCLCANYRLSA